LRQFRNTAPPALFGIVAIAAIGVPLPITLLLIIAGSLISQGAMDLWWAIGAASVGSILGDQIGYAIGRWAGPAVVARLSRVFGKRANLEAMEAKPKPGEDPASLSPAGCSVPWDPGSIWPAARPAYPWHRFLFWDILGELTGAAVFISLGLFFSDRVMSLYAVLGDLTWAIAALLAAILLGYLLLTYLRRARPPIERQSSL